MCEHLFLRKWLVFRQTIVDYHGDENGSNGLKMVDTGKRRMSTDEIAGMRPGCILKNAGWISA